MMFYRTTEAQQVEAGGFTCTVPKGTCFEVEELIEDTQGIELDPRWLEMQKAWFDFTVGEMMERCPKAVKSLEGLGPPWLMIDLAGLARAEDHAVRDLAGGSLRPGLFKEKMEAIRLARRGLEALQRIHER